jgi:hypothetical protein
MELCKARSNYGNDHDMKDGRCLHCGFSTQPVWSGIRAEKMLRKDDESK